MSHSANYTDTGHTTAFYQGRDAERQRIVRLLIDKAIEFRTSNLHQQADYFDLAIELIKGEQK